MDKFYKIVIGIAEKKYFTETGMQQTELPKIAINSPNFKGYSRP